MLIKKDLNLILKNKFFYGQYLMSALFIVIYFFFIKSSSFQEEMFSCYSRIWTGYYTNMIVAVLIVIYLSASSIYPMVAMERDSFLLLRQLPVRMSTFIWNKLIAGSIFIIFFSQFIFWFFILQNSYYHEYDIQFYINGSFVLLFITLTIIAINLSFGMIYHEFETPVLITYKTLVAFFVSMFLGAIMLAIAGYAIYAYYLYVNNDFTVYPFRMISTSLILIFIIGMLVSSIFLDVGLKKLEKYEIF